ncbi:protein FLX-like 1 [Phragmites australis]|uniref:protein FLX-like 1 n=1 Tax=Phragmites australis TaxID=29695 RepID=UPI002D795944|nr:protein FLX-like 1 [Phragmites australis]
MAGRHRNPLPPSFPRGGGGNNPPPPPHRHPYLPPHYHIDDYREPPRLPPHHHLDDFRDPPRLPPGHPDNFSEHRPHRHHFAGHGPGGPLPPQPHLVAALEERLGAEIEEAHTLLGQNQRLAATHVALVQEVAAARHELGRTARSLAAAQEEGDLRLREVYERSMKMDGELRAVDEMRAELAQVRRDIQKLGAARQELMGQVQGLAQDLARSAVDLQQVSALKAEIQEIRHETQHLRSGIELEKKGYAESYEQGQEMQKNLISVASEVEKLRAEVANAEKRSRAAVSAGNQGYVGSYGNPKANFATNPYNAGYSMNQSNAADSGSQYGPGATHGSWGAYDMQRASGQR